MSLRQHLREAEAAVPATTWLRQAARAVREVFRGWRPPKSDTNDTAASKVDAAIRAGVARAQKGRHDVEPQ